MGRPSDYETKVLPRLDEVADWCRNGATDKEVADRLGIHRATICDYKKRYPEFADTLKKTKDFVDAQVENALLKSALNGNVTAQIYWLNNRRSKNWRNKQVEEIELADIPAVTVNFVNCGEEEKG